MIRKQDLVNSEHMLYSNNNNVRVQAMPNKNQDLM